MDAFFVFLEVISYVETQFILFSFCLSCFRVLPQNNFTHSSILLSWLCQVWKSLKQKVKEIKNQRSVVVRKEAVPEERCGLYGIDQTHNPLKENSQRNE